MDELKYSALFFLVEGVEDSDSQLIDRGIYGCATRTGVKWFALKKFYMC